MLSEDQKPEATGPTSSTKVIFVNRYFYPDESATSQILTDLAFDLAERGFEVAVVTGKQLYEDPRANLPSRQTVRNVSVHRCRTTQLGRRNLLGRAVDYLTFYASAAWTLWRLADDRSFIVAKTDPPLVSIIAALAARMRGARLVNWLQDVFPEVGRALLVPGFQGIVYELLRRARNTSLAAAHANVVIGRRMAVLLQRQGVAADRITVIPNWADGATIRPIEHGSNSLRVEWGLKEAFVVMYSGNLGRAHDYGTIVDAADRLRERADIVFLFIGGGALRGDLLRATQERGLTNVRFLPYQPREQLGDSLGVGDAHLVTLNPDLEGLIVPSKFYGIAAAGRPTLFVGDVDGEIARIVREGNCGYAVPFSDGEGLANRILELANDSELRTALGRNARALFEDQFERRQATQKWCDVLRLGKPSRTAEASQL